MVAGLLVAFVGTPLAGSGTGDTGGNGSDGIDGEWYVCCVVVAGAGGTPPAPTPEVGGDAIGGSPPAPVPAPVVVGDTDEPVIGLRPVPVAG